MVFVYDPGAPVNTAIVALRGSPKYVTQLIIESFFGIVVTISNMAIILVFFAGWKRLFKNDFYIILANLIVCTSLKGFVELAFILPYYILQSDGIAHHRGYFTHQYEYIVFNVSVFADYGVLFFSMLVAINRFIVVRGTSAGVRQSNNRPKLKISIACFVTWVVTAIIPLLFYLFECQFVYNVNWKTYRNDCLNNNSSTLTTLIQCLVYLSYACAIAVLIVYLLVIGSLRQQRKLHNKQSNSTIANAQIQLLKKSLFVFILYAASILCVFAMSFASPGDVVNKFDIPYIENLLNLSIAAVYPICFLVMSGEMKSILVMKLVPSGAWAISSNRHSTNNIEFPVAVVAKRAASKKAGALFQSTIWSKTSHRKLSVLMVFVYGQDTGLIIGVVAIRSTGTYTSMLIAETMFGLVVALSNMIVILTLVIGWRRLVKNNFYIVLANLIACTSLKAFVELAFVVPYYVMQGNDGATLENLHGFFSKRYEYAIFNVTVLADYGVLFFSALIAINRFVVVNQKSVNVPSKLSQRAKSIISCGFVWIMTAIIPLLFFLFECQYEYQQKFNLYRNECNNAFPGPMETLLNCLIYVSYMTTALVFLLYLLIARALRRQRRVHCNQSKAHISSVQLQLIKQSAFVFTLYAASIFCVFFMSSVKPGQIFGFFEIAYFENLLNLSIAAVYPICFLAMSGEMKSILIMRLLPRGSWVLSSIRHSSSGSQQARNEIVAGN